MARSRIGGVSGPVGRPGGHSLVELLVVLAVLLVVLALAAPGLMALSRAFEMRAARDSLVQSLQRARFEAVRRGGSAVVCASVDGSRCSQGPDWQAGWLVFFDGNANDQLEAPETPLLHRSAVASGIRIQGNTHVARRVRFASWGTTQGGTLRLCPAQAGSGYQIVIHASGAVRTGRITDCPSP